VAAAGDDSLVIFNLRGDNPIIYECDFSRYDSSQLFVADHKCGPLYELTNLFTQLGIHQSYMDMMFLLYTADVRIVDNQMNTLLRIQNNGQLGFPTGCPMTTLNNTFLNISMWYKLFYFHPNGEVPMEDFFLSLGFTAKLKTWSDITNAFFLKGHFVPASVTNGDVANLSYVWTPSLVQILKMGYTKTHPRTISEYSHLSEEQAFMSLSADVCRSWLYYDLHPILLHYCNHMIKLSPKKIRQHQLYTQLNSISKIDRQCSINWEAFDAFYQIDNQIIKDVCSMIDKLKYNVVFDHPFLQRLDDLLE
jgi:hypothetical protein